MAQTITIKDFFNKMPSLPIEGTKEFQELVDWEIEKCLGGVIVDNVFISGWLYWHLNHWNIRDDYEDEYGNVQRKKMLASLRDNEWEVGQYLEECRIEKKGYMHIGVRQFGKSEIMASYMGYHAELFQHTQNVVVGGNDDDLQLIRDKIDFGIKNVWRGLQIPKLDKDTKKNMTRLGFKAKGGDDHVWSYIIVRNVSEGNKTEGPAGVTAKAYATDEVGKFAFAQSFEAAKPAFKSKYGWRCVPLLFGTGGSFDKGADAERFFFNPEANNLLAVTDPETGKKTAIFMSGLYRIDCKYLTNLGDYLRKEGKINWPTPNLDQIPMWVSDKEKARELILKERAEKAKDPDKTELQKLIMYYPLTPRECFLSNAINPFPTQAAQSHLDYLLDNNVTGRYVRFYRDERGKAQYKFAEQHDRPISEFPTKGNLGKDCPIIIWEEPISNAPRGLYIAGADPYNNDVSDWSDSLGTVCIWKRMTDVAGETYQDMVVASMASRPNSMNDWHEQVELLLEYYNAVCFPENAAGTFIQYFERKNKGHYLGQGFNIAKEINPNTRANQGGKIYGLSPTIANINYCMSLMIEYCKEQIQVGTHPETREPVYKLGITRILDPVLLQEIIKYNPEEGNYDRIVAFRHALAYARHLDKYYPIAQIAEPEKQKPHKPNPMLNSPFNPIASTFSKSMGTPFTSTKSISGKLRI
jgi:hypothetical protein